MSLSQPGTTACFWVSLCLGVYPEHISVLGYFLLLKPGIQTDVPVDTPVGYNWPTSLVAQHANHHHLCCSVGLSKILFLERRFWIPWAVSGQENSVEGRSKYPLLMYCSTYLGKHESPGIYFSSAMATRWSLLSRQWISSSYRPPLTWPAFCWQGYLGSSGSPACGPAVKPG